MKFIKNLLLTVLVILVFGVTFFLIDQSRFKKDEKPLLALKKVSKDGNTVTYYGLFYKVILYPGVSPKEKFENIKDKKMVFWFQDYKRPLDSPKKKTKEVKEIAIKEVKDFYEYLEKNNIKNQKDEEEFDIEKAKDNNYYVYQKDEEINRSNLDDFLDKYKDKKTAFIKIASQTKEGNFILYHVLYDNVSKKVYVVADTTRDKFASEKIRRVELYILEKIEINDNQDKKELVVYEGDEYRPEISFRRSAMLTNIK